MTAGAIEILIVAVLVVLFFGPRQIPKVAKSLKNAKMELKKGMSEDEQTSDSTEA